jgi:hypothetical protein
VQIEDARAGALFKARGDELTLFVSHRLDEEALEQAKAIWMRYRSTLETGEAVRSPRARRTSRTPDATEFAGRRGNRRRDPGSLAAPLPRALDPRPVLSLARQAQRGPPDPRSHLLRSRGRPRLKELRADMTADAPAARTVGKTGRSPGRPASAASMLEPLVRRFSGPATPNDRKRPRLPGWYGIR